MKHDCDEQATYSVCVRYINTVSTFSDALCGSLPPLLCCLNMNVLNQKILTFKCYLNDRKTLLLSYTLQVLSAKHLSHVFKFVPVSWSTFVLHVCWIIYIFFFLQVLCSSLYCTLCYFTVFSCITCLFWLWICSVSSGSQVICGGGRLGWELCKEVCTYKAIITFILAFWGTRSVESGCDGMSNVVVTTNKSTWEETLACTWCALKWKGTSLVRVMVIFSLAAVGSCFISFSFHHQVCLNWYFGLYFSRLGVLRTNTDKMNQSSDCYISIGLGFYFSLQIT